MCVKELIYLHFCKFEKSKKDFEFKIIYFLNSELPVKHAINIVHLK